MGQDLMAMLQGAGPPPSITIPGSGPDSQAAPSEDKPLEILQRMITDAKQYMTVEPDEEDKATMAQLLAKLQQYLAKDQKDRDGALGNPSVTRQLRKSV